VCLQNILKAQKDKVDIKKTSMMKKTNEAGYGINYELTGETLRFIMDHPSNTTQIRMTITGFQLFLNALQELSITPFNFNPIVMQAVNNFTEKNIQESDILELNSQTVEKFALTYLPSKTNKQSVQLFKTILLRHKSLFIFRMKVKNLIMVDVENIFLKHLSPIKN
jgi:hypothetical protein